MEKSFSRDKLDHIRGKLKTNSMTDTRTQIAEVLMENDVNLYSKTHYLNISDNIIAALPDILRADPSILRGMVKQLVWENFDAWTWWAKTENVTYIVNERSGQWTAQRKVRTNGERFLYQTENTEEAAKSAANAHHIATTLQALGVTA